MGEEGFAMEPPIQVTAGPRLLAAHEAGNTDQVVAIITESPLEAWFGVPPDRMREILRTIPPDAVPAGSAVRAFRLFLNGPVVAPPRADLDTSDMAALFFDARARGEANDAVEIIRRVSGNERMNALFDETAGLATFQAVQLGLSQMLAGDHADALASFTLARRTPPPATLTALLRDAYVKPALVHALHGDPGTAKRELDLAAALPRTSSWVEQVIDAHAALAAAAIVDDDGLDDAVEQVERIPVHLLGELWPYRVDVLFRLHLRRGRLEEAEASVTRFRPAASGYLPGQGVPGSVFAASEATAALLRADVARARSLLSEVDERPTVYRVLREAVAVASGDSAEAIHRLIGLHAQTAPLRQLEFFRVSLLSAALLGQGDTDDATELLRGLVERSGGLHDVERVYVPDVVAQFAHATVEGWPDGFGNALLIGTRVPTLTPRERTVLNLMASELTRAQIAEALFVSENTVKSQQRTLFRKLGATTRVEALMAAHRLGLI